MADEHHPVQLEIYRNLFRSVAEEMGAVLKRTAYSPNIKERRDYSCAVFDGRGRLLAMGDHMPVHLGSMPMSVEAALKAFPLEAGDVVMLNDPFAGGTHLPDITMVMPVYEGAGPDPLAYLASRAHHSDVGGMSPGSMPLSREIFQEGIRIPPLKLYEGGQLQEDLLELVLTNVRTPVEREGDLAAQVGALRAGERRLQELCRRRRREELEGSAEGLQRYAEAVMRRTIAAIPDGRYQAEDVLDDAGGGERSAGPVTLKVALQVEGEQMRVDFSGSSEQVQGCVNAVEAITRSAVYYVLRCLAPPDAPSSAGLMRPVEVSAPAGSIVNARYPAATAAGNVETSQRIVDVLLRALAEALPDVIPAASSGTMNNLSIGATHPESGQPLTYYETIGGGMGAGPRGDGNSDIHTHMTNSLNTPVEAVERYFPFRVREYRLRFGSHGRGRHRGGDGVIRSLEMLADCQVTLLSERRKHAPWGLQGGRDGKKGSNLLISKGKRKRLPGKFSLRLNRGELLVVETPGGGGWGELKAVKNEAR